MTRKCAPVPVKIVPDRVPSLKKDGVDYVFKRYEIEFLREYSTCLDEKQAFAQTGLDHRRFSEMMENPYIQGEMAKIQRTWRYRGRMTQEFAGGEHMRLMEKFEDNYDVLESKERPKMAGVLAKMSEATMKATGLIGAERDQAMPTVIVNMNMGVPDMVDVTVNEGENGHATGSR